MTPTHPTSVTQAKTTRPKKQKTPSLASLRKLAKRKGYEDVETGGGLGVRSPMISPPDMLIQPANDEAYRILFKCLNALPDKETSR